MVVGKLDIPMQAVAAICRKYRIRELSIFGSSLRDDFGPESDVDLLVDFEPDHGIGLIKYGQCQDELAEVLGRRVDLVQKSGLKALVKQTILDSARVVYAN
jgi:uncharacterized protein